MLGGFIIYLNSAIVARYYLVALSVIDFRRSYLIRGDCANARPDCRYFIAPWLHGQSSLSLAPRDAQSHIAIRAACAAPPRRSACHAQGGIRSTRWSAQWPFIRLVRLIVTLVTSYTVFSFQPAGNPRSPRRFRRGC